MPFKKGHKIRLGIITSLETRKKQSESRKKFYQNGGISWNKGIKYKAGWKHTEETRKKLSEAKKLNNPMWRKEVRDKMIKTKQGVPNPKIKGDKNGNWNDNKLTSLQKLEIIAGRKRPERCELCNALRKIVFDHNHKTGKFRGWLCYKCNLALGMTNESIEILTLIIKYIQKHEPNSIK
jgi:hypothetical protein